MNKLAVLLNEAGHEFPGHFKDIKCIVVGLVLGTKLRAKLRQNSANFKGSTCMLE